MDKQYCTVEDIENYLTIEIATEFEDVVDEYIVAVSEMIRIQTNRDWLADTEASARSFNGNGLSVLNVGDFIGTPVVEIGNDYLQNMTATTAFITSPYNIPNKDTIALKDSTFDIGIQNVRVTAKWGYAVTVPKDIKQATVILASAIVLAQNNQDGEIESEKIGNYQVKYKDDKHRDDAVMAQNIINGRRVILI